MFTEELIRASKRNLDQVFTCGSAAGAGRFSRRCEEALAGSLERDYTLLVPSGTAALELSAILANLRSGDEVVMPDFGFPSAANAVVLRGATPVFVDVAPDTLNINVASVEGAITRNTKAILAIDYGGVCCEWRQIDELSAHYGLITIEDAAQAYGASYYGRPAGSIGSMACLSFHATKNISCGEGGAFVTADAGLYRRAEVIREKGTNRAQFLRGEVQRYLWMDIGSSFLLSEYQAAVLAAQLEMTETITDHRLALWNRYNEGLAALELREVIIRPYIPPYCQHNGHIYRVMLRNEAQRDALLKALRALSIEASFHFQPLHVSPAGRRYGRPVGPLSTSCASAAMLLRLPMNISMVLSDVDYIVDCINTIVLAAAFQALT